MLPNEGARHSPAVGVRLRDYAVEIYERPNVSSACLLLQTRGQVDVNLILLAAWVTDADRILSTKNIADARAHVRAWHDDIVRAIRKVRQQLKLGPPPAPSDATEYFREKLKKLEIEAELIELDHLEHCLEGTEATDIKDLDSMHERVAEALTLIVINVTGRRPDKDETAAILQIAAATQAYAKEKRTGSK
jgi:uncharacterized protein (TIGR02444 family)